MSKHTPESINATNDKGSNVDILVRFTLVVAVTFWSFKLLMPFLGLLIWAFILTVALHPLYLKLNRRLGQRSVLTATIITLCSLLLVVSTLLILTNNMAVTVSDLINQVRAGKQVIPAPPASIATWPLIGDQIYQIWLLASSNLSEAINNYASYFINTGSFILAQFADKGIDFIIFILSVVFSGYLLVHSNHLITIIRRFANRLAPKQGPVFINIIRDTMQNVAIGVIGIALFQALLFGLILLTANVPGAGLISLLALLMCIVQIGLIILIIPVAIWLFFAKSTSIAILYTILLILIGVLDTFLKPYILARGLGTPMLVIFLGLLGGIIQHGLMGVFIGPVVLAVYYNLFQHWLQDK